MRHVREHGYPAPEVVSVDGADMVLERATALFIARGESAANPLRFGWVRSPVSAAG